MNAQEIINFTDDLIFARKGKHINNVQRLIIKAVCSGIHRYEQIARQSGYSITYIRQDAAPKLWQLLTEVFGEKVKKSNFRATVERLADLVTHEGGVMHQKPECCRVVGLVGIGGIGKTHLSVKLAEQTQEQFDYVIWRSLRNAPSLQQILDSLLQFIANSQSTDLPATVDEKIALLINYLRKRRCLLVLDDVETILHGGDCTGFYKQGYEDYGDFFKRLGEGASQIPTKTGTSSLIGTPNCCCSGHHTAFQPPGADAAARHPHSFNQPPRGRTVGTAGQGIRSQESRHSA